MNELPPAKEKSEGFERFSFKAFAKNICDVELGLNSLNSHVVWLEMSPKPMVLDCVVFGLWGHSWYFEVCQFLAFSIVLPDGTFDCSDLLMIKAKGFCTVRGSILSLG